MIVEISRRSKRQEKFAATRHRLVAFPFAGNRLDLNVLNSWLLASAAAAAAVIWWLFRSLHAKVDRTDRDAAIAAEVAAKELANFKLHCAETYVTSNTLEKVLANLNDTVKAVFSKLERIEDKLDLKADK